MAPKRYVCTCLERCKGGKEVSRSTYHRHKSYRHDDSVALAAEMSAVMEVDDSTSNSDEVVEDMGGLAEFCIHDGC